MDNGTGQEAWVQISEVGAAPGTPVCKWQRSGQGHLQAEAARLQHTHLEISCTRKMVVVSGIGSQS